MPRGVNMQMTTGEAVTGPRRAHRVAVEALSPEVDHGRFPAKCIVGDRVRIEADVFADGHDRLQALLLHRHEAETSWHEVPMEPLVNDRWAASVAVEQTGRHVFCVEAWPDRFRTWRHDLAKRAQAASVEPIHLREGAALVAAAARRAEAAGAAHAADARRLHEWAAALVDEDEPLTTRAERGLDPRLLAAADAHPDRRDATRSDERALWADPERARASAWYELFPRSAGPAGRHGTFADVEARLPYIAAMGFDTLYLPPIHPIGRRARKGFNHSTKAGPDDPGSPWAIGGPEGGHTAVHPELGTLTDFDRLIAAADRHGIAIALDMAFQCSPDHPWVREHPEWFRHRADGTIQHAENPPKKYEDIYPLDFDCADREGLWNALLEVMLFWTARGVRVFRVDNPHTKPFPFWEWLIREVRARHPEALFLSEAFTRPKVMYRLAKVGFTHSYTYFTWRNTRDELREYFTELTRPPVVDFFRPHLWPNTPDILSEHLQTGGRPAFVARFVLAATLGANYGIYGPAFELVETRPWRPGSEEYHESEKYGLRQWDLEAAHSLRPLITRVNRIRGEHRALHYDRSLRFHHTDNPHLIAYSKRTPDGADAVLVVVNLDPHHTHSGWIDLQGDAIGLPPTGSYQMHDLLTDARHIWHGQRNYVQLDPVTTPAHIFAVRRHVHTEADFDYYL